MKLKEWQELPQDEKSRLIVKHNLNLKLDGTGDLVSEDELNKIPTSPLLVEPIKEVTKKHVKKTKKSITKKVVKKIVKPSNRRRTVSKSKRGAKK